MQKTILLFVVLFALVATSFAQVEEAVRYRVQGDATLVEQQISVSNTFETTDNLIVQHKSNSQLEELGGRYGWARSTSQLEELGARYGWTRSNSQLEELGARYGWTRSNSQLEELGARYGWTRSNSQLEELGAR
ncbi:MAG: hypothetical protein IT276_15690, partial [Ignavibacteriaceae bacterium]|nr:hypothetical protein [Ignavibacteriaceae bacterium]